MWLETTCPKSGHVDIDTSCDLYKLNVRCMYAVQGSVAKFVDTFYTIWNCFLNTIPNAFNNELSSRWEVLLLQLFSMVVFCFCFEQSHC